MENVLANAFRGGGCLVGGISQYSAVQNNPEVLAKLEAEREEQEKRYRKRNLAEAIIALTERLVIERGETPEIALKIAKDLTEKCESFLEAEGVK